MNNENFQDHLRQEEEQVYSEIRARKHIEEEDRRLAELLQSEGGETQRSLQVTVPPGVYGGQVINVQVSPGA